MPVKPRTVRLVGLALLAVLVGCPSPTGKDKTSAKASAKPATSSSVSPAKSPSPDAASPSPAASASTAASPTSSPSPTPSVTGTPSLAPSAEPSVPTVRMRGMAFSPATLSIKKGTGVNFVNDDTAPHTVSPVGEAEFPSSGTITAGASKLITFNAVGTQGYDCDFHPMMTGTVTVTP